MKPLVIVTTFNRKRETEQMLTALVETTALAEIDLVIVDNNSTDGTVDAISDWASYHRRKAKVTVLLERENIGCPRALNAALALREAGQPVVKLDNDLKIITPGWVDRLRWIERVVGPDNQPAQQPVAMIGAWYEGCLDHGRVRSMERYEDGCVWKMSLIIGHAVWHSGPFMDRIGYFDVLSDEHLYGFEDLIASQKANKMNFPMLVWDGWKIENIQRFSALGRDGAKEHTDKMRPLYDARVRALADGGPLYTGPDGRPGEIGSKKYEG